MCSHGDYDDGDDDEEGEKELIEYQRSKYIE